MELKSSRDARYPATIETRAFEYTDGEIGSKGFLAFDKAHGELRPGVLVFHEWWGLNDYAKMRARQLASMGYCAFAADMFGNGETTEDPGRAGALAGAVREDRGVWRRRANSALSTLIRQDMVDRKKIAAIGFCFGGSTALELAWSGASVQGVVSFHGRPTFPSAEDLSGLKRPSFLILHGADDPLAPREDLARFIDTLGKTGNDWQLHYFGNTAHAFSNPDVDKFKIPGLSYNAQSAERAWEMMQVFFGEIFG